MKNGISERLSRWTEICSLVLGFWIGATIFDPFAVSSVKAEFRSAAQSQIEFILNNHKSLVVTGSLQ